MDKYKIGFALLILVISFIADHYFSVPDFLSGLLKGFAIGILLMVVIKNPRKNKAE